RGQSEPLLDPHEEAEGPRGTRSAAAGQRLGPGRPIRPGTVSVSKAVEAEPSSPCRVYGRAACPPAAPLRVRVPPRELAYRGRVRVLARAPGRAVLARGLGDSTTDRGDLGLDLCPLSRRNTQSLLRGRRARAVGQTPAGVARGRSR